MSAALGFGMSAIAVGCWGIYFIPAKKFKIGDGFFFQWIMCTAVFWVGFIVQMARGNPRFEPFSIIGGILWCSGNLLCLPVIQLIGMGLGILIWGSTNLVIGWASGRFGLFGIDIQEVNNPILNSIGVVICCLSLVTMIFIKPKIGKQHESNDAMTKDPQETLHSIALTSSASEISTARSTPDSEEIKPRIITVAVNDVQEGAVNKGVDDMVSLHPDPSPITSEMTQTDLHAALGLPVKKSSIITTGVEDSWMDRLNPITRRIIGFFLAILAGILFGLNYVPPQYMQDQASHDPNTIHSTDALDYVFSHFSGIFLTSTVYFIIYCIYKKNKPCIDPELVLPAFTSGTIWAIACVACFVANQELGFVISFPVIMSGPGIVSSLCGIILFKEIQGLRNFLFLGGSILIAIIGVVLIALSKLL